MLNGSEVGGVLLGALEGASSAAGSAPNGAAEASGRVMQFVLRLLRSESIEALSRELAVPIYRLEECRDRALADIHTDPKECENDPVEKQLDDANRRVGELIIEVEILRKERQAKRHLVCSGRPSR